MKVLCTWLLIVGSVVQLLGGDFKFKGYPTGSEIYSHVRWIQTNERLSPEEAYQSLLWQNGFSAAPNFGLTDEHVWLRVPIRNASDLNRFFLEINNPVLDSVDFFMFRNGRLLEQAHYGDALPFHERKIDYQSFMFEVNLERGEWAEILVRTRSSEAVIIPMQLISAEDTLQMILTRDFIFGVYSGLMAVMFLYNFFIYLTTRDRNYLWYILYIFSFATAQAALLGYFFRFVSPNLPAFSGLAVYFFSSLAGVAALEFAKGFLNLKEQAPRFYKGAVAFQVGYILAFLVKLAGFNTSANLMLDGLGGLVSLYAVIFASYLTAKGSRPARFFLIAWVLFLLSIVLFVLKNLGVIPQNNFTQYLLQIGSGIEAILLSLALADKINTLTYENQLSQARALDMARENERIVKEQNTYLERKVQERTLELQEANVELRATLDHLKETQGQLVEAEKMASLGQLTAGIAHEINNPINFVTSNVSPLKRDFDDLIEIVDAYEKALQEDDPKAAYEQVQELRKELDFDFLTDEIQSLINGIKDGANRTAEIVRGLRTFSRLDEDDVKMADIHEGLDSTLTLLNNKIRDKIEVVKDYHSLPEISCYPGKMNQLFMNILSNAIQAIEMRIQKLYDETPGKITIQTRQSGKNMVLTIADNGIGMTEDVRKRIFEPFFTTKEVGEGTGLGLSIVFKIIEKHHGNISVMSDPGKGTTFTITLPLQQPNNPVS